MISFDLVDEAIKKHSPGRLHQGLRTGYLQLSFRFPMFS